nr:multidrug and toxin extrusion protein 2-like [Anolis sagrei ordinatus]
MTQTYGSRNVKRVGTILQRGILILLLFCFPCWAIFLNAERILLLCRQDPEVSRLTQVYVMIFIPALPAAFIYQLQIRYLQSQAILLPQVITGVVANVLNIIMNAVFLYTFDLGVVGSAWANTLSQNLQPLLLFLYVWWKKIHKKTWGGCASEELPQGMSVASGVRVGNALGAGDVAQAKTSCIAGLLCSGVFAVVFAGLLAAIRNVVAYIFTSDKEIVALVSKVMMIFAPFHLFDAMAATCGGVLRGAGKQKIGAIANAVGYYVVGLPIGITLMFKYGLGVMGLWTGLIVCISLQAASFLVVVLRMDWKKAAEEAQIRAGLGVRLQAEVEDEAAAVAAGGKAVPLAYLATETSVPNGAIFVGLSPDDGGAPSAHQLLPPEDLPDFAVLSGKQLLVRRGLAVALAVGLLVTGVLTRFLLDGR